MPWSRVLVASAQWLGTCASEGTVEEHADEYCDGLPAVVPSGAVVRYARFDSDHLKVSEAWYTADADCSKCVRLSQDALQAMWTTLCELNLPPREEVSPEEDCFPCGAYHHVSVSWPRHMVSTFVEIRAETP
jgi:hypothetical protein